MASPPPLSQYDTWSREDLITRLAELELASTHAITNLIQKPLPKPQEDLHPVKYLTRKIALKFCYSGWEYGGLAFQNMKTTLPTVEGVLFEAMVKARLIDSQTGFEGCGWEKCGRTDRGVSAAGQVISLWVRSGLGPPVDNVDGDRAIALSTPPSNVESAASVTSEEETNLIPGLPGLEFAFDEDDLDISQSIPSHGNKAKSELDYVAILNRLLPPTIRILAWSPVSPDFSARFSCTHRHYKYFFSSAVVPGPPLDIDRMRAAASRLLGEHDFRNLCKVDPGKQTTIFKRVVLRADIEPLTVDQHGLEMYVFNLVGSAFLYHQVRHIMAVLFMVGHGLEDPSVMSALMNVEEGLETNRNDGTDGESQPTLEVVRCKPEYQMADALPLVLWDCGYPDHQLDWRTNSYESPNGDENRHELYQQLHTIYQRSQIYMELNQHFLAAASQLHPPPPDQTRSLITQEATAEAQKFSIPLGGGNYKRTARDKYVPLLKRNRLDPVDIVNERWRLGKGFRRNERKKLVERSSLDLDGND